MALRTTCRPGAPCTVLLIEDDPITPSLIIDGASHAEPGCFMIEHAASLAEAVPKLAGVQYDAVLLDLGLPDSEGVATLHVVQKLINGAIPIIVLTGSQDAATELACFEYDAAEFITKPFKTERLLTRIRHAILRHRRWVERCKALESEVTALRAIESVITGEPQTQLHQAAEAILRVATSMAGG